jgi:hypothetical protein
MASVLERWKPALKGEARRAARAMEAHVTGLDKTNNLGNFKKCTLNVVAGKK